MTTSSALASQILPVSILTGPSTRALVRKIVAADPDCRFGLLASPSDHSGSASATETIPDELVVEKLAETSHPGVYDPAQISAQIAGIGEKEQVDHLMIECDSRTHPLAFASLFLPQNEDGPDLSKIARLTSIVLSIDSQRLLDSLVHGSRASGPTTPCMLADQVEAANLVILSGDSAASDLALSRAIIAVLNPRARITQQPPEGKPGKFLDSAASFDFKAAAEGAGWRKTITEESSVPAGDRKVTTVAYQARRPFHPEKFWNLLQSRFHGVFRAQGYFWLATRMNFVGGLNIAGAECQHLPAGEWLAAQAPRNESDHLEMPERFKKVWVEPFGDRRQDIAFVGIDLDPASLRGQLDACLLDDSEFAAGESSWALLPDPFPAWSAHVHDHECEDHDCCDHH